MSLGDKILHGIKEKGTTKAELAKKVGIPYTTLDSMVKRNPDSVNMRTLFKIADALDVSVDYLARDEITDKHYKSNNETKRALPPELENIGVEWLKFAKDCEESGLTPEQLRKLADALKEFKG